MDLVNRVKDIRWKQNHRVTKELAKQLLSSLLFDLHYYCYDKDIELGFQFDEDDYAIEIFVKEPWYIINERLKSGELDNTDLKIASIECTEVLWCILNYEAVLNSAYSKIDDVCNILYLENN